MDHHYHYMWLRRNVDLTSQLARLLHVRICISARARMVQGPDVEISPSSRLSASLSSLLILRAACRNDKEEAIEIPQCSPTRFLFRIMRWISILRIKATETMKKLPFCSRQIVKFFSRLGWHSLHVPMVPRKFGYRCGSDWAMRSKHWRVYSETFLKMPWNACKCEFAVTEEEKQLRQHILQNDDVEEVDFAYTRIGVLFARVRNEIIRPGVPYFIHRLTDARECVSSKYKSCVRVNEH